MATVNESIKERLEKLRSLRTKLCSQGTHWTDGFAARDYLVAELSTMKEMLEDTDFDKNDVLVKLKGVLNILNPVLPQWINMENILESFLQNYLLTEFKIKLN